MIRSAWKEASALPRDRKTLRNFGLVVGIVLVGIAIFFSWRNAWATSPVTMAAGVAGVSLLAAGLLFPRLLRLLYPVWMAFALILGTIMTAVLLSLVFYLVVTPIGLVLKMLGKDPMHRRPDPSLPSYWIARSEESNDVRRMEKYY